MGVSVCVWGGGWVGVLSRFNEIIFNPYSFIRFTK